MQWFSYYGAGFPKEELECVKGGTSCFKSFGCQPGLVGLMQEVARIKGTAGAPPPELSSFPTPIPRWDAAWAQDLHTPHIPQWEVVGWQQRRSKRGNGALSLL
ncbi:hypothetical protein KIL84_014339 [Mauremys mutica]|uniref:Uncharacterized protein n=1 Tax=Mauremys mutica TaxID=74926 RepID=A0A9D3XPJ1_9SAUR|nr:hypothetical protein KIL84_014339 [Mauremys mutica]